MGMLSRYNPAGGVADFWDYIRRPQPHRWWILLLSMAMTASTMAWLFFEKEYMPPAAPKVTYISTFEPGRTDAQIAASNAANQERQDELAAEAKARSEKAREVFRSLGRAAGMDVEKIEREAAEERAREEAAERARYSPAGDEAVAATSE